jgi:hypothetical protein
LSSLQDRADLRRQLDAVVCNHILQQ